MRVPASTIVIDVYATQWSPAGRPRVTLTSDDHYLALTVAPMIPAGRP